MCESPWNNEVTYGLDGILGDLTQLSQQLGSSTDMYCWVAGASAGDTEVIRKVSQLPGAHVLVGKQNKTKQMNISIFPEKRSGVQKG